MVKIQTERLPDLSVPRNGHLTFCAGGEYVVAGGHTDGFVPTPTAEFYKDGRWHLLQMVYNHDCGSSVVLKSGKVLLLGGNSEPLGIGQTFLAEMYDPANHTFNGFSCMDQKRALASALELDSGRVVISGNWYHDDGIELFDGNKHFTHLKGVSRQRSFPLIIRTAKDDALIFGSQDTKGHAIGSHIADRLKGDSVLIPLLEQWQPLPLPTHRMAESFIGDESKGLYSYLFPVKDHQGQLAIAKVENGEFSLLPTDVPVPMQSPWGGIEYLTSVLVDRQRERAYLTGINSDFRERQEEGCRHFFLCIDYKPTAKGKPAILTLYYSDPFAEVFAPPVLCEDGSLLIAGGMQDLSNFTPSSHAYLLHFGRPSTTAAGSTPWLWFLLASIVLSAALAYLLCKRKPRKRPVIEPTDPKADSEQLLMDRIRKLMDERQVFLNNDLKLEDISKELGVHRNDISACINSQTGCTVPQFINGYRVEQAKQLLRDVPEKKVSAVWMDCGFTNEQTFFRIFRATTGMTPKEFQKATNKM
ncbi:MAG: helix-turn-helix domain-containing protein [Prevotella sp.]|nr:helix-turn-helix domain-containing protein [Prevotella sp.]